MEYRSRNGYCLEPSEPNLTKGSGVTTVYKQGYKSSHELNENGGSWRVYEDQNAGGSEFYARPRAVS